MRRIWRQCAGCCEKDGTEMKRFQFGLDTVLQYKRQVLDGAQNEYAEVIQRVRQQERRLREAEARHRSLNQQFRRAEAEGITIADAMGYEMGLRMLEGEIQREGEQTAPASDGGRRTAEEDDRGQAGHLVTGKTAGKKAGEL